MPEPQVGQPFPGITLLDAGNKEVRVPGDFRGKTIVLSWYPWAFSPVCTEEFTGFTRVHAELTHLDAEVVAVSCDHWYTTAAYARSLGATYPFLSDWSRKAARHLGLFNEALERPDRVIHIIDRDGVLRWKRHYARGVCPVVDDFLGELKKLA